MEVPFNFIICNVFDAFNSSHWSRNDVVVCWFQGGLTATDVFAVEWIQTGVIHFGMTVSYYGFVSDGNSWYIGLNYI